MGLLEQADRVGRAGLPALGVDRGEELGAAGRPRPAVVVGDLGERRERLGEARSEGGSRRGEVCGTGVHGGTCYQTHASAPDGCGRPHPRVRPPTRADAGQHPGTVPRRGRICAPCHHRPQRQGPPAAPQPAGARRRQPARLPAAAGHDQARLAFPAVSPTAASTRIVLERRFNGPPATANGGYACGVVARHVDGPATVSLRRPVPLGTPLELERHDDGHVTLHDGPDADRRGRARRCRWTSSRRTGRSVEEARAAVARRPAACPRRSAPAGSAPRPVRTASASRSARWRRIPHSPVRYSAAGRAAARRRARPRSPGLRWTARATRRRCGATPRPSLLASMRAELLEPDPAGEPLIVVGWSARRRGPQAPTAPPRSSRRDGRMLARAEALWIRAARLTHRVSRLASPIRAGLGSLERLRADGRKEKERT